MTSPVADPASFKDPDARVVSRDGRIFRAFTPRGAERFRALQDSGLFEQLTAGGGLIDAVPVDPSAVAGVEAIVPDVALVVEHPRVPFISYCYEWPFEMLRDAALLQLDLAAAALERGFVLKDAKPYNVQFIGARPVHIDVSSFEPWQEGKPWQAYAQFCRTMLNPLLLEALAGVPFQPWMRSAVEGIAPEELARLLPLRKKLRRGVFSHVSLQA